MSTSSVGFFRRPRNVAAAAFRSVCLAVLLSASGVYGQAIGDGFGRDEMLKVLTTGPEATRLATLARLESFGDDPRVAELLIEAVGKVGTRGVVRESTLELLYLLGEHIQQPDVPGMMWKMLRSDNWRVIMLAVDSLGELGDPRSLDDIIRLIESSFFSHTYGFRKCVIEALMKIEDARSIEALIGQLPKLTGQLEYDVIRYLSHVSRQRFGERSELWKTWLEDNAEDFHFTETEETFVLKGDPPEGFVYDRKVPEFFGTYIYAKRLIFVLDVSSSMSQAAGQGSRIELAKRELAEAVADLPEDTYFTILLFDAKVVPAHRDLVAATEQRRQQTVAWVRRIKLGRGTATFDALKRSFNVDGNAEAIFFLSDGQPTKGEITDPARILKVITKENFFRRIAIYTFGFPMDGGGGEQLMKNLAEWNNGAYKAIK